MKAILRRHYGSAETLQFTEIAQPKPAANEVLIEVRAASINPLDRFVMQGSPWNRLPGMRTPKNPVIGCDIAGRVVATGSEVRGFHAGDEVFGGTGFTGGGFAEYACAPEASLGRKPMHVSFEQAASLPIAATTALQGLRDHGRLQPGQSVLIEGGSGGVGTFAIQLARVLGAEVTAVCSTRNVEMARTLGANHVIDYTEEDFMRSKERYDMVLGVNAHHCVFAYKKMLRASGTYIAIGSMRGVLEALVFGRLLSRGGKKIACFVAKVNRKDLEWLAGLVEERKIVPVIDRRYPLSETSQAMQYLALGHARGKVILTA